MKQRLQRIIIGSVIFAAALLVKMPELSFVMFLLSYMIVGGDVLLRAGRNIIQGKVFDENFLMGLATIGAFVIGEFSEGVAVMLFYQVGELFQSYAVAESRKSIAGLMDIRPDYANVKRGDEVVEADPYDVHVGDYIVIKAGEKIPLDAIVVDGSSMVDTSALTGEAVPQDVAVGSLLLSGCINLNGLLTAEVIKEFEESTVSKILDLVENASNKKSQSEKFITRFARYYTPIVVIIAALLALVPPLIIQGASWQEWLSRALIFLVVSCPCALVISIPLSFFGGIGGASRKGILVKGSNYLEALAQTETVVFDKTGTLTQGVFNVQKVEPMGVTAAALLEMAAYAESNSSHPIAQSLLRAYGQKIEQERIREVQEIPGLGVVAIVDDQKVMAGNSRLMADMGIQEAVPEEYGTVVHVAIEGRYAGYILIADALKKDAAQAISTLKSMGIKQIMLTGDNQASAAKTAQALGLEQYFAGLLPADKVAKVEELLNNKSSHGKLAFVGDGINDAPVLARADIGIAMGGLGSDAAIEAADVVLMTDEPSKLLEAIKISKKTLQIAQMNTIFAIGVKVGVLVLGALGMATMWAAVFADVGVAVIAILNSFRALRV
jgi:Cd2+/Zn2+-exporting ATPase